MKLLVTGGLGFIGSNFIRYVLRENPEYEVVNYDKLSYGSNLSNLKDLESDKRYKFVRGDICDIDQMRRLMSGVDVLVNFAAESHVDRSIADPFPFFRSNSEGVLVLCELMRLTNHGIRLLHVSTDEVYGEIPEGSFDEDVPLKPSSPYAATKAAGDLICLSYVRTYDLDIVITRCTNNFGPYQFPEKLIPKTIIRAYLDMKVPIYGTGKNVRDWIYVVDHCVALDLAIRKGAQGQIYNIASGKEVSNADLVRRILKKMGKSEDLIEFVEDRPGHDVRYSLDTSKTCSQLGWRVNHSFSEALEQTVDWYVSNENWWRPLADEDCLDPTPWKRNREYR